MKSDSWPSDGKTVNALCTRMWTCMKNVYKGGAACKGLQSWNPSIAGESCDTLQPRPSCQWLIMRQGGEEQLWSTAGIQGPETHYPEWFFKSEQKLYSCEKRVVTAATVASQTLRFPAVCQSSPIGRFHEAKNHTGHIAEHEKKVIFYIVT